MTRPTRQRDPTTAADVTAEQADPETICPECSSDSVVRDADRSERVCTDCGLVIEEENIDRYQE